MCKCFGKYSVYDKRFKLYKEFTVVFTVDFALKKTKIILVRFNSVSVSFSRISKSQSESRLKIGFSFQSPFYRLHRKENVGEWIKIAACHILRLENSGEGHSRLQVRLVKAQL